jgi:hypothetical protein
VDLDAVLARVLDDVVGDIAFCELRHRAADLDAIAPFAGGQEKAPDLVVAAATDEQRSAASSSRGSSGSASRHTRQAPGVYLPALLSVAAIISSAKVIVSNLSLTKTCYKIQAGQLVPLIGR